jgi:hypothetical protein
VTTRTRPPEAPRFLHPVDVLRSEVQSLRGRVIQLELKLANLDEHVGWLERRLVAVEGKEG